MKTRGIRYRHEEEITGNFNRFAMEKAATMTDIGDVVLVYIEEKPAFFARVEAIDPDVKPDWYVVKMLVLQIPLMVVSWILRRLYVNGEQFTMGGRPVRIVPVVAPVEEANIEPPPDESIETAKDSGEDLPSLPPSGGPAKGKVLSLADRRKKNHLS